MNKNTIVLVVFAVILGSCWVVFFSGWFDRETIQIIPTIRPSSNTRRVTTTERPKGEAPTYDVSFAFDGKHSFTKVRVFVAEDLKTNNYPTALWDLISDSRSVPVKYLVYGEQPRGMKPAVPRARPEPLQPGIDYVLLLEAGKLKAQTNFHTREIASR